MYLCLKHHIAEKTPSSGNDSGTLSNSSASSAGDATPKLAARRSRENLQTSKITERFTQALGMTSSANGPVAGGDSSQQQVQQQSEFKI